MCWAEDVIVHHAASAARDPRQRRILGIRNTLWTAWLRRPPAGVLRRTAAVLRSVPKDPASAAALAQAGGRAAVGPAGPAGHPGGCRGRAAAARGAATPVGRPPLRGMETAYGLKNLADLDPQQARIDPRSAGVPGPGPAALPQDQVAPRVLPAAPTAPGDTGPNRVTEGVP